MAPLSKFVLASFCVLALANPVSACDAGWCASDEVECTVGTCCRPCNKGHYCDVEWTLANSGQMCTQLEHPCPLGTYQPNNGSAQVSIWYDYFNKPKAGW